MNNKKLHSIALVSVFAILFLILVSTTASAATLEVGNTNQYKTIQSAVDYANSGDIIKVSSGTYKEQVDISGKEIMIQGVKNPKVYGFYVHNGGSATITGFKITDESQYSIGIDLDSGKNTIKNNVIIAKDGIGIIINLEGVSSMPTVTGNTFKDCTAAVDFIPLDKCPTPTTRLSTFKNNKYTNCGIKFGCDIDLI